MKQREEPISLFHRQLISAKATNMHGIILNFDDMQMGRLHPLHYSGLSIPQSSHYPIIDLATPRIREEMRAFGFTDFWDYFFNINKAKASLKKENSPKKKHWSF
jgi:hypothetical protein